MTRQSIWTRHFALLIFLLLGLSPSLAAQEALLEEAASDSDFSIRFTLPNLLLGDSLWDASINRPSSTGRNSLPPAPLSPQKGTLSSTINAAVDMLLLGMSVYASIANLMYGHASTETGRETLAQNQHFDKFPGDTVAARAFHTTAETAVEQAIYNYTHIKSNLSAR